MMEMQSKFFYYILLDDYWKLTSAHCAGRRQNSEAKMRSILKKPILCEKMIKKLFEL